MAKVSDVYPRANAAHLVAADLSGSQWTVTIHYQGEREFSNGQGEEYKKAVFEIRNAHGKPHDKLWAANPTNARTLAEATGQDEMSQWDGSKVCLFTTQTNLGPGIAVRLVEAPPIQQIAEAHTEIQQTERQARMSDDVGDDGFGF